MYLSEYFGSANAQILLAGRSVGLMQGIQITDDLKLQRLPTLWNRKVVGFVAGTEEVSFTASKAFVELESVLANADLFVSLIGALLSKAGVPSLGALPVKIGSIAQQILAPKALRQLKMGQTSSTPDPSLDSVNDFLVKAERSKDVRFLLLAAYQGILSGEYSLASMFSVGDWELSVLGPAVSRQMTQVPDSSLIQTSGGVTDNSISQQIEIFRLRGCRLTSRQISISTGNVIVMEAISAVAKNLEESYMKSISPSTVGSRMIEAL